MVLARTVEDTAFAARLKADPKAALAELLKVELPPDLTVHVFQETSTDLLLRLPPVENDEMSEKELDGVAGGLRGPVLGLPTYRPVPKPMPKPMPGMGWGGGWQRRPK